MHSCVAGLATRVDSGLGSRRMSDGNGLSSRIKAAAAVGGLAIAIASGLIGFGVAKGADKERVEAMQAHVVDHERRLSAVEQQFAYIRGKLDSIDQKVGAVKP